MMNLQRAQALLLSRGLPVRLVGDGALTIQRVHTDTRSLQAGDFFVALKGDQFDAHQFLPNAQQAGAQAVMAQYGIAEAGLSGLEVVDSKLALGALASAWRRQYSLPLIAVTGSNGKTTVTQMIASILKATCAEKSWATKGNLNNDIGVPLTLLGLTQEHHMAVVELVFGRACSSHRSGGEQRAARTPGVYANRRGGRAGKRQRDHCVACRRCSRISRR
jgi:UDP-N-acetylmuramyl pentapeptide synthase